MAQTLAPSKCQEWEQEDGWRPLPVSDESPGEPAPSALVSIPPTQLCLLLALHRGPASAPDHRTSYFLKEIKSLWRDSKDPGGSE